MFGKPSTVIAMDLLELPNWLATRQLKVYWTLPVSGTVSRLSNDDRDMYTVIELLSFYTRGTLFLSHLS